MLRIQDLATARLNADALACGSIVEVSIMPASLSVIFLNFILHQAYLHVQLGIHALDGARHNKAAYHFTAAVNASALASKLDIHYLCEDFVVVH